LVRDLRNHIIDYYKRKLVGPSQGDEEEIEASSRLSLKYTTGMLYPFFNYSRDPDQLDDLEHTLITDQSLLSIQNNSKISKQKGGLSSEDEDLDSTDDRNESVISNSSSIAPSCIGISFGIESEDRVQVEISFGTYVKQIRKNKLGQDEEIYKRKSNIYTCIVDKNWDLKEELLDSDTQARLNVRWRKSNNRSISIVTLALRNGNEIDKVNKIYSSPEQTYFQVKIKATTEKQLQPIAHEEKLSDLNSSWKKSEEEEEEEFLYQNVKSIGRGHGCSVKFSDKGNSIETDFLPEYDIPLASFDIVDKENNKWKDLLRAKSLIESRSQTQKTLDLLAKKYRSWIESSSSNIGDNSAGDRLKRKALGWAKRIEDGIDLLSKDDAVWQSFVYACEAMIFQNAIRRNNNLEKKIEYKGNVKEFYTKLDQLVWRPFQIAFFLGTVESLVNKNSEFRDEFDIIWFPTGGGKTEAYLLLAAFELFHRRLSQPKIEDSATGVISRYSLRFIATQQFERTSYLVGAMELMRVAKGSQFPGLGKTRFSLGLYIGREGLFSRNVDGNKNSNYVTAKDKNAEITSVENNPYPVSTCFLCNTPLIKEGYTNFRSNYSHGFHVDEETKSFSINCINNQCYFSNTSLPFCFSDEDLYKNPPSILLGTVDKFVQLGLQENALPQHFFKGASEDLKVRPMPTSLIIQDELHLMSGPLGTIDAPIEAALDVIVYALSSKNIKGNGWLPKRIGSSATLRNTTEHIKAFTGRKSSVFPVAIKNWDDAFFFTKDPLLSRRYVGIMGQHKGYAGTKIDQLAAMLQAPQSLLSSDKISEYVNNKGGEVKLHFDPYWTLLSYHHSKKLLGATVTDYSGGIAERLSVLAEDDGDPQNIRNTSKGADELSADSRKTKSLTAWSDDLKRNNQDMGCLDFVPCTSIISVGIDVDRLGLMQMNGMPRSTAEYIQATSRVGRKEGKPGIVFTLFSQTKPRDRSFYEDFVRFHSRIYSYIEPSSVTPYTTQARKRTLYLGLVISLRNILDRTQAINSGHKDVDYMDEEITSIIEKYKEILYKCDPDNSEHIKRDIDEFIDFLSSQKIKWWYKGSIMKKETRDRFVISSDLNASDHVAYAPTSCRNVDTSTELEIYNK
jgi:hypothetical protein